MIKYLLDGTPAIDINEAKADIEMAFRVRFGDMFPCHFTS